MSDNRRLQSSEYNSLVAAINYDYCKKHKYDFIYYRPYLNIKESVSLYNCIDPNTNTTRHASWSKLLSAKLALELPYDYVVYIDSDCIFKNRDFSLDEFIRPYLKYDTIFLNNKPWGDHLPCGGFFVCKVGPASKQFIQDWYAIPIPSKNKVHAWEQDALWTLYKKFNIAIVDEMMFQEKEGQFLRHICHKEHRLRIPYFQAFLTSNQIDVRSIEPIQYIEYNTAD